MVDRIAPRRKRRLLLHGHGHQKALAAVWLDNCKVERLETNEAMAKQDIRFCPFCSVMQFDMAEVGASVHCEVCGIEVAAEELVETV
ncbi:MAG: hypothetical protein XU15_C0006G0045 [candidate division NC10 bacterium CSP1-5]|nr:MAG: hypothetical protein XU15_C0006G0045 [candidate division NC10 bacterium CSP1-5]